MNENKSITLPMHFARKDNRAVSPSTLINEYDNKRNK